MKPLVVVIVGPTASGKTRLSIELAKRFDGEVVSADSMQIYRTMDIGTAKPSPEERCGIPHHMMDLVDPSEEYTLKDYLADANACVQDILARGKLPILVGGTGLYVTSFLNNLTLSEESCDADYREVLVREYDSLGGDAMLERLRSVDPELAARLYPNDRKRILRGLEVFHNTGIPQSEHNRRALEHESPYEFLCFGLTADDRAFLYDRIDSRVCVMIDKGLESEVRALSSQNCSRTARQAIGYRQFDAYFAGEASLEDTIALIQKESRNYAKRQLTWFRRDQRIRWFSIDRFNFDIIMNFCAEDIAKYTEVWYNKT